MLPDLNSAGQQAQTLGVEWQSGETWMECAGDGYLDMMSPEEQQLKRDIQYDQEYLWAMLDDEAKASIAVITDDEC